MQNWQEANRHYLIASLELVRHLLERSLGSPEAAWTELLQAVRETKSSLPAPSSLDQLCDRFGLSEFERWVLLLCVGMELDASFPELCAQLQGDVQWNYPTFNLALSHLPGAHWSALSPTGNLRRWRLLEVGPGRALTLSPLRVDERVLHYLIGVQYLDERLKPVMEPAGVGNYQFLPLQPSYWALAEKIVATWAESISTNLGTALPVIQLCGEEMAIKRRIATSAAELLEMNLQIISAHAIPTVPNDLSEMMQLWEREAVLSGSALLLDCDELETLEPTREVVLNRLVETINSPLIITTKNRRPTRQRPLVTFDVPGLTTQEQRTIWQESLGEIAYHLNGQIEQLVAHFNLNTPSILSASLTIKSHELAVKSQAVQLNQSLSHELGAALWEVCRVQARPRLDDLAQRIDPSATWDDLVLPEAQQEVLKNITAHVRQRTQVYERWGFGKGGKGLGITALFAGGSGTGKTMSAEVIAHELKLDLYRIDLSAVISKYIGETEKNLRKVFDAAEAGGAVLLFDEADALFGKRSEVKDSHDRHANVEVAYLLQRMEAYQGLAILTTNLKDSLDSAFMRRIRFVVRYPFPDPEQRSEIWRRVFPTKTPTAGLDFKRLSQLSIAGGNIRNIALNAAFLAADAGEPVMMKHILSASRSEYVKLERSLTDAEIKGWVL